MARARYTPDRNGVRELGRSPGVQSVAMEGARTVQAFAAADDREGEYVARPATVPVGWRNEPRAGAVVREAVRGNGAWLRTLARAAEQAR